MPEGLFPGRRKYADRKAWIRGRRDGGVVEKQLRTEVDFLLQAGEALQLPGRQHQFLEDGHLERAAGAEFVFVIFAELVVLGAQGGVEGDGVGGEAVLAGVLGGAGFALGGAGAGGAAGLIGGYVSGRHGTGYLLTEE